MSDTIARAAEVQARMTAVLTRPMVRLLWEALGVADSGEVSDELRVAADAFIETIATAPNIFFRGDATPPDDTTAKLLEAAIAEMVYLPGDSPLRRAILAYLAAHPEPTP